MPEIFRQVEEAKIGFLAKLKRDNGPLDIQHVAVAASEIDQSIKDEIYTSILRNLSSIFSIPRLKADPRGYINLKGNLFELSVSDDVLTKESLFCAFVCRDSDANPASIVFKFDLQTPRRYKSVCLIVPDLNLKVRADLVETLVNGLFEAGYSWLNNAIIRAVAEATDDTSRSLYDYMSNVVPAPLLEDFWFTMLVPGKGASMGHDILMLNETATARALKTTMLTAGKVGKNPAEIVTEIFSEIVDFKDSPIVDLCRNGKVRDLNLKTGKFFQDNSSFNLSLQAVYGSTITLYPVVTEGGVLIAACFKTKNKESLVGFLDFHKRELQEIASRKADSIDAALKIVRRIARVRDDSLGKIVELVGRFSGAFMSTYVKSSLK